MGFKRTTIALLSLVTFFGVFLMAAPAAFADVNVFDQACNGETVDSNGAVGTDENTKKAASGSEACSVSGANPVTGGNGIIAKVTRLIAYIAGIAAFILMIIGGIMYISSDGDTSRVSAAKNTVLYAAIGLVIVIAAQGIIVFFLNHVAK